MEMGKRQMVHTNVNEKGSHVKNEYFETRLGLSKLTLRIHLQHRQLTCSYALVKYLLKLHIL